MGAASETAAGDDDLYAELRSALDRLRPAADAGTLAATLLVKHYDDRTLLGLVDGGDRAVYYSGLTRCIAKAPCDPDGVAVADATPLGQAIDDPERWVELADVDWDWCNPAFR